MKKLLTLISLTFLLGTLNAQEQGAPITSSGATPTEGSKDLHDLYPLSIYDPRIRMKTVSFVRRIADNGRGEILDVLIELESRVMENHDYAIYVLAANEQDNVNEAERRLVPYPPWRKIDLDKESRTLYFTNVMPTPITAREVWGEEVYNKKVADVEKSHWQGFESDLHEPTFTEVVHYLCKSPLKSLPFTLFGETGPTPDKIVMYNYISQTPEEKKRQVHDTLPKHTFTIFNNKYKTSITSHHYTQYRPNFWSFNKVAVLVFDTKRSVNSLLFRKFYNITDLKMTY